MKAERITCLVFGCILLIIWTGNIFLLKFLSAYESLFAFNAFNCLACLAWIFVVCITNSKNKSWLMVLTTVWITVNVIFLILFWLTIFISYGIDKFITVYPYFFIVLIFAIQLHAMLLIFTCRFYNLFDEKNRRLPLFHTRLATEYQNRKHQNVEAGRVHDMNSMNDWHSSSPAYFDTHMSSHDTHTTSNFDGGCGDMGGCDSGGGGDSGGTCD